MLILVRHAPPFRRWHRRLGERLEAAGHRVRYEVCGVAAGRRHLALERRLYGVACDWDAGEALPPPADWTPDLTIVLAGPLPGYGLAVRPDFAGGHGEASLLAAARSGLAPVIVVRGGSPGALRLLARGRPAIEDPYVLARALEGLLPRLVALLALAVERLDGKEGEPQPVFDAGLAHPRTSMAAFLARGLRHKLAKRLGPARRRPDHWRLALRRDGEAAYRLLSDDPSRFRADPFLFAEAGRLWLFYEDYPYAGGKGVIRRLAVAAIDHGASSVGDRCLQEEERARIVLEEDFHLSYPLVLRHEGAIYMLPETSASSRVQLYRADPFPDRWTADAVLLRDRRLADATPVLHEGRWWLFATSTDDDGSSWDQLDLFHAPDLLGPWVPHPGNPVLVDAGAARPAGLMWHENGVLMRPAQDCRAGYGAGLVVCRVDRLDEGGYRQSVVRRISPPPGLGATGLHTINRAAGWEVVDLKVPHPRRAG